MLKLNHLGRQLGLNHLFLKDEGQNPTGSFKALGLSVAVSRALELGVREFVIPTAGNAGGALAAYAARAMLNLPYYPASMTVGNDGTAIDYDSSRSADRAVTLVASYQPAGAAFAARPGTIEYFLTERYCLYHVDRRGRPYRLEIHHPPWPLQAAEARFATNTMAQAAGITLPAIEPLLHFSRRQDMVAWAPKGIGQK